MTNYTRPTYEEIKARVAADLAAVPDILRGPLSATLSRLDNGQHAHLDWVNRQCSPLTCDLDRLPDWAVLYGVDRLLATAAQGTVEVTGNVGTMILADTLLRGQNGLDYQVVSAITLGAAPNYLNLKCTSTGLVSNMAMGQTLTLIDPIAGVDSSVTVTAAAITGGADDELVDAWRARVADEWRTVVTRGARSGKPDDYRAWAKNAHPSVTGALVRPHVLGLGTVLVQPICNALVNRLPTTPVLNAISAFYESIAPAGADWRVGLPNLHPVTIEIDLFPAVDTLANRTAIGAALATLVLSEQSETSVLAQAEIDAAIASVTDQYTRIQPTADIAVAAGEVLTLNPIVWA